MALIRSPSGEARAPERSSDRVTVLARRDRVLVAGVLLIGLQTVVRAMVVVPSFYWQDDFVHMEQAARLGLSAEFLLRDHNDHLEIGAGLVYWLIGRDTGLSFLPAALCLLALQLIASCLLLAVLRQLFGRSPWILVPFAGYLFTPLQLPVATWWAAGLEAIPMQIGMLAALLGLVRALRERSWRWAAFSAGGHALGLLFYEKALLVLPTLVAVVVLVEWAGEPLGRALRRRELWRYLLPHGLLVAAYVPLYLSVVDSADGLALRPGDVLPTIGETLFGMLVPGLLGGPWTDTGAENTVFPDPGPGRTALFAVLALAVVAASVWLRGRRALRGWLLVGTYLAVDLALVQLARTQFLDLVARDPRYVTDALPVVAIGICAAFARPPAHRRSTRSAPRRPTSARAALAAGALLVVSCLGTTSVLADGVQHRESRAFVHTALRVMDDNPGISVLNTRAPYDVNIFLSPDLQGVLRVLGQERRFDRPGTDVRMFDGEADLRPVTVVGTRVQATGPVADCGWPMSTEWQPLGALPEPGPGLQILQMGYRTDSAAVLHLSVGDDQQTLAVPPGRGTATFVVTGLSGAIEARVADASTGPLCMDDLAVGAPWPAGEPLMPAPSDP